MCGRSQACPIGNGAAVAPTTPDAVEPCAVIPYRKQGNRGRYGKGTLECAHRSHSRGGGAQRPCQRFGPSATPRSLARSDYSTAVCEDAPRFFARNCDAPNITKVLVGSL